MTSPIREALNRILAVEHTRGGSLGNDGQFYYKTPERVFAMAKEALAALDTIEAGCRTSCVASKADGVLCPDDECDIESGVRAQPSTDRVSFDEWRESLEPSLLRSLTAWQLTERAYNAGRASVRESIKDDVLSGKNELSKSQKKYCEEAKRLAAWVESPEGQKSLREASEEVRRIIEDLNDLRRIDPELLNKPMTI